MAISLSLSPTGLSGPAEVSPLVFALLPAETATAVSTVLGSAPDVVALSDSGQLLSAVSTFRNDLAILQGSASGPAVALVTAQRLADTFNRLQGSVGSLQTALEPLAANSPAALLDGLESTATASLSRIGIALQSVSTSNPTATGSVLRIDPGAFNAALANAPAGTQAVLSNAVQALIDLAAGFEAQLAEKASAAAASVAQAGVPPPVIAPVTPVPAIGIAAAAVAALTPALPETIAAPAENQLPVTAQAATTEPGEVDGSASAATLALQRLLADPAVHARKNLLDPAYASLNAAFHVGDFALPGQTIDPNAGLPDFPPQVLPVAPADGVAYYKEASEDRPAKRFNDLA